MSGTSVLPRFTRQSPALATIASAFAVEALGAAPDGDADAGALGFAVWPPPVGLVPSSRVRKNAAAAPPASASSTTTMIRPIAVPDRPLRPPTVDGRGGPQTSPVTEPGAGPGRPP